MKSFCNIFVLLSIFLLLSISPSYELLWSGFGNANACTPVRPGTSWHIQLQGEIDTGYDVDLYDVDLFDTPESLIASLKAAGKTVICYFSAGTYEEWRPDADTLLSAGALGAPLPDWEGEWWLDIRLDGVREVMQTRLDLAKAKGCDGVDPDNMDGYSNANGLGLTAADQLDYNRYIADEAHARGLLVGLKNDLDQIADLVNYFDFAINEECFEADECHKLNPFIYQGKAVFNIEYAQQYINDPRPLCSTAKHRGFDTLILPLELDGSFRISCNELIPDTPSTLLEATNSGDTYALIDQAFTDGLPGHHAYEVPDCGHDVQHIDEVWDSELNSYVFRFKIHNEDSDRCLSYDRARVEIKTYSQSPEHLKATLGETVQYQWEFKLPNDFAVSPYFTHLHQLKAVGGNDQMPLFTLTARIKNGLPYLELRHSPGAMQGSFDRLYFEDLGLFTGKWMQVTETIYYHESHGRYALVIRDLATGEVLFSFSQEPIETWRTGAEFLRPKWGIYRKKSNELKDETVLFNCFRIKELYGQGKSSDLDGDGDVDGQDLASFIGTWNGSMESLAEFALQFGL